MPGIHSSRWMYGVRNQVGMQRGFDIVDLLGNQGNLRVIHIDLLLIPGVELAAA